MKNIIAATIIAAAIIIYGLMQIYAAEAQRYHLHAGDGGYGYSVLDKRTGRIYRAWGCIDAVKGEGVRREFRESATEDQK